MKATEEYIRDCNSTEAKGSETETESLNNEEIRAALLKRTGTMYAVMPPARKD